MTYECVVDFYGHVVIIWQEVRRVFLGIVVLSLFVSYPEYYSDNPRGRIAPAVGRTLGVFAEYRREPPMPRRP